MANRNDRMNVLRENNIDISNFFDLQLRIPLGATATVNIDGRELVVRATRDNVVGTNGDITNTPVIGVENLVSSSLIDWMDYQDDPIAQGIMDSGYIFNSRVDGRWLTAQTFKMLNSRSYNVKTRQYESGWDAYLRNNYGYMYQFDMMIDELHRLSRMERDNDPEFERLSSFFTKEVVHETCKQYLRQLKKFVNKQKTRKCHGVPYVKLNKYGNVFVRDLNDKVYSKIENELNRMENASGYTALERCLKSFMRVMIKLPYDTPKCSQFKDAFKGKGAYVTLLNIAKFHNVNVISYETGELLNRDDSVAYVESKLEEYRGEYWRFHELLKATIVANNFDLQRSIASQQ